MCNHVSYLIGFLQDNLAVFVRVTVAGEKKGDEVVGREVNKVGFTTVVLDFSENLKINGFIGILSGHVRKCYAIHTKILREMTCMLFSSSQHLFLDKLYIKIPLLNTKFSVEF